MPQVRDFYELLGVSRDATAADVRWAYERALNRANRDGAHKLMTELSQAYDTLSDQRRRSTYDRHGLPPLRERSPGAAPPPPPWRIVKESPLPVASYDLPRRCSPARRTWRVPSLAVFCLGLVAGLVLAMQLTGVISLRAERQPPAQQVVCAATPAGPAYSYRLTAGHAPACTNGAGPQVVPVGR